MTEETKDDKSGETKNEKFIRMRDMRVPKAVHATELLANLSSHHYESSPEEAEALVLALGQAVTTVAKAFGIEGSFQIIRDDQAEGAAIKESVEALAEDDPEEPADDQPAPRRKKADDTPAHLKPWPEGLTREEDAHIWRIARELDRAINAIQDRDGQGAINILTGLTSA